MNLTLITDAAPAGEPISVTDARAYLRIDGEGDTDQLQAMISAARLEAEYEHGRELARKQWRLSMDRFVSRYEACGYGGRTYAIGAFMQLGGDGIALLDPLVSVDSFTYRKIDGSTVTLVKDVDFIVDTDKHPGAVYPAPGKQWPDADPWPSSAVQITFTAGVTPDTCPATIKQGMLLLVTQWYEARIPFDPNSRFMTELPHSVTALFRNGKLWQF